MKGMGYGAFGGGVTPTSNEMGAEYYQASHSSLGQPSAYGSSNTPGIPFITTTASNPPWDSIHKGESNASENGVYSNPVYFHNQQTELTNSRDPQDGGNLAPSASTSASLVSSNGAHDYAGYSSYSTSSDPSGYGNTGYQSYCYGYQQQGNTSYSQQAGAYQNSGVPYQPVNSFQNTSPHVGPTSYSGTYYNPGVYQTSGGYQSTGYNNQSNWWNEGNYGNYSHYPYSNYTATDANGPQNSNVSAVNQLDYQQNYKQWAEYYSQTQTSSDVSCAPGTETTPVTTAPSSSDCPIPGVSGSYAVPNNSQPPPPGTSSSWKPDVNSSETPQLQVTAVTHETNGSNWTAPGFQIHQYTQPTSYFQKPFNSDLHYDSSKDLPTSVCPQGPNSQFPTTHQVSQSFHLPLQSVSALDTRRTNKMQIPTNPRIPSNLALGLPRTEKDHSSADSASKPAYISVSLPKSENKVVPHDGADGMFKPDSFPPSLLTFIERAIGRCKDDSQRVACQAVLKEVNICEVIITKASSDGTLFTRNWDTEPLFSLPNNVVDPTLKESTQSSMGVSSLLKYRKSPSRRTKSRWEPMVEEKVDEKLAPSSHDPLKDSSLQCLKERGNSASTAKRESKEVSWTNTKYFTQHLNKSAQRPAKKPRFGDSSNAAENGDNSSDSDKELGLTAYYSGAITLANSPEEKKKRESRYKRFETGHQRRSESKQFRSRGAGAVNYVARRASALLLAKNHEDGCSRAVEDIDWDSLTVKGTCQEIEKRYLRLTSAPDPATVRPEEVLEKALLMVQSSQKNYLYKCDQLKSIRQDLTVQRIHNELTVKVYETHARLALEAGDLPEYNQCQSQLKSLYAEGIKGCHMEFSAYNLLCVILHSSNNRDLLSSMARLSAEAKKDEAVKHALAVRAAVTSGNYILFFRLYKTGPNLNTCLMDLYVEKMRFEAVRCMARSYRPTLPVAFIAQVLGFMSGSDDKDVEGVEECEEWLRAHGASLTSDNNGELQLDAKATASSLYMPDPDDAVAHGDSSLAVNDFLTKS
ncbi:hypothetical protein AMTRI_Chr08g208920 [Amborella trichopoda]